MFFHHCLYEVTLVFTEQARSLSQPEFFLSSEETSQAEVRSQPHTKRSDFALVNGLERMFRGLALRLGLSKDIPNELTFTDEILTAKVIVANNRMVCDRLAAGAMR